MKQEISSSSTIWQLGKLTLRYLVTWGRSGGHSMPQVVKRVVSYWFMQRVLSVRREVSGASRISAGPNDSLLHRSRTDGT